MSDDASPFLVPEHEPDSQSWACAEELFKNWGSDGHYYVGGQIFEAIRTGDRARELFWRRVLVAVLVMIDEPKISETQVNATVH